MTIEQDATRGSGRFAGRTAIVTGAASGIGAAATARLLAEGATVIGGDLNPDGVVDGAIGVAVDVTDPDAVDAMVATAIEATGRVDVLINNAGIGSTSSVVDCTPEEWDQVFAVNARGIFLCVRAVLPQMLAQEYGSIVNTASVAGIIGLKSRAAYCASKGAVIALTKQVAVEYAGTGVRCNCISPGTVDTPWVGRLLDGADDPVAARASLVARQPIGRLGNAEEIAAAALYLASDEASFVTGTSFVIDGGLTAA